MGVGSIVAVGVAVGVLVGMGVGVALAVGVGGKPSANSDAPDGWPVSGELINAKPIPII